MCRYFAGLPPKVINHRKEVPPQVLEKQGDPTVKI